MHTAVNCDDGIACTVDTCTAATGACVSTPDDSLCNPSGSFCNAQVCEPPVCPGVLCNPPVSGCIPAYTCVPNPNNPCSDPATCDEATDTCGGCLPPTVGAIGARYLTAMAPAQGSTPVGFMVRGVCQDPDVACVSRYIQSKCVGGPNNGQNCLTHADCPPTCAGGLNAGGPCTQHIQCPLGQCLGSCDEGTLGPTPFFKLASQWEMARIRGPQIRPDSEFLVHTVCNVSPAPVFSRPVVGRTWLWGDADGDLDRDALDIVRGVDAFKGQYSPGMRFEQVNVSGCTPDTTIDGLDIAQLVDAFKGFDYPCSVVCP